MSHDLGRYSDQFSLQLVELALLYSNGVQARKSPLGHMLTVHHLNISQSERIIWLLEELELPYELCVYRRDPSTQLAPAELRSVHPLGSAPVLCDGEIVMAESGAIIEYVIARYGNGRLCVPVTSPQYPDYLYWFHYANGSLMTQIGVNWITAMAAQQSSESPLLPTLRERLECYLQWVEDHLSQVTYFTGSEFTAADIMMHFPFGTMKAFYNVGLDNRPNIKAWFARISDRVGYQRAMKAAGHEQDPALGWGATRGAF